MKKYSSHLEAKVAAANQVAAMALELSPGMFAALAPFVGQRITVANGLLSAKVKAALPVAESTLERHFWYSTGNGYTLTANFKTSTTYGSGFACYAECTVFLGDLTNGVLNRLYDPPILRTNWTAAEVEQARQAVKAAQDNLRAAQRALGDFGEYDT